MSYRSSIGLSGAEIFGSLFVLIIIGAILGLIFYFFQAYGIYSIAKNRRISAPGLAFIPFIGNMMLGAIADDINLRVNKRTHFKIIILSLSILQVVVGVFPIVTLLKLMSSSRYVTYASNTSPISGLVYLVSIAVAIFTYMALYRVYSDYVGQSASGYLVLSILVSITMPFLIFSLRNKDSMSIRLSQDNDYNNQFNNYNQYNQYNNTYTQQPNSQYSQNNFNQPINSYDGYNQQNNFNQGYNQQSYNPQGNNFNQGYNNQPSSNFNQGYNTQPNGNFNQGYQNQNNYNQYNNSFDNNYNDGNGFQQPQASFQPYGNNNINNTPSQEQQNQQVSPTVDEDNK